MQRLFAPGCALMLYKAELAQKIYDFLQMNIGDMLLYDICCRYAPDLKTGTFIINTCPGCDRCFRSLYEGITTISLWEVIDACPDFPFPDYEGKQMAVHDACPVRTEQRVHHAVRNLLQKMHIEVVEPQHTKGDSLCCGDSLYGTRPVAEVKQNMRQRASSMPCDDVVVYCISCIKSMHIGGKSPRYLPDLLFGEQTKPGVYEPEDWHSMLDAYISTHRGKV